MRRRLVKIANRMFPGMIFHVPREKKAIYITFDDGPHPETTPRILELLAKHDAKATFFCLGRNVEKYPAVYDSILAAGHATGNHSWSHPNGWTTSRKNYLNDVRRASEVIGSNLFRPPYGRIGPGQYRQLKKEYKITMWTRQFADYRHGFNPGTINISAICAGDILVMHDSPAAIPGAFILLKRLLTHQNNSSYFKKMGW